VPRAQPGERFGGREKGTPNKSTQDIRAIADAIAEQQGGWDKLFLRFANSENEDIAFKATQLIAAYRFGKPKETHEVSGVDGEPIKWSVKIVNVPAEGSGN
jgi:hypothetical protein